MRWMMITMLCLAACATGGYRYYDADHGDYHRWNETEVTFYTQWEGDTRRPHRDFDRRSDDERREYWAWRHEHEHEHDRDHDH